MEDITTIIQTLGFPIALVVYLLYDRNKSDERHRDEIASLQRAIESNTDTAKETQTMIQTFMDYMAKMLTKDGEGK